MYTNRLEDLWQGAATDGASTPAGPRSFGTETEFQELMKAWLIERQHSVEYEFLLKQSRRVIARLLEQATGSVADRTRAIKLIESITRTIDENS